jgi:hypothetical protein
MWEFLKRLVWFFVWGIIMAINPNASDDFIRWNLNLHNHSQEALDGLRVSPERPIQEYPNGLNYERCAALHNKIVERGWTQAGNDLADLSRTTWWENYGGDSALTEHVEKLDPSVIAFLKRAIVGDLAFHRYNGGLADPESLFYNVLYGDDEDDSNKRQFITLYTANYEHAWSGHTAGIVLDQEEFTATQQLSMEDSDWTMSNYARTRWPALEDILSSFLGLIERGKTVAVNESSYSGKNERIGPWILNSYTELDLEEALGWFSELIIAIEARMPSPPPETGFETGLLSAEDLARFDTFRPDTFARRFLERARKPRFKYLAPGLQIVHDPQPFASVRPAPLEGMPDDEDIFDDEEILRPILFFQSSLPSYIETTKTPWGGDWPISPWKEDFSQVTHYPSGLYLTEAWQHGSNSFEDGCKLLLPFTLGGNGWARTSDLALFDERDFGPDETPQARPRSTFLFQQGYNHFIQGHDVQLMHVLRLWTGLVERGVWEVDENGVKGGMEKWRDADTEEHWEDYVIFNSW